MKKGDFLYELIHAFSKEEKRYFRKYASRHILKGKSNQIRLFDFILSQTRSNDAEIRAHFSREKLAKNLPASKYDLYKLLLKSLHAFHSSSSTQNQLRESLHHAEILYQKGLYHQCDNLLRKIHQKATKQEKFEILLEVNDWESRLHLVFMAQGKREQRMDERVLRQKLEIIRKIETETTYRLRYAEIHNDIFLKGKDRDFLVARMEAVMSDPLFRERNAPDTYRSCMYFREVRSTCLRDLGDREGAMEERALMVTEMKKNRGLMEENLEMFVSTLTKLMVYRSELGHYSHFMQTLHELRGITDQYKKQISADLRARIFARSYFLELSYYPRIGAFDKAPELEAAIERGLEIHGKMILEGFRVVFYYLLAWMFFGAGNLKRALKWSNKIGTDASHLQMEGFQTQNRLLQILIHYELGNEDLLPYLIRSAYRNMAKRNTLTRADRIMMDFLRKDLPKAVDRRDLDRALEKLQGNLAASREEPASRSMLFFLDIESWILARRQGITMAEAVNRRSDDLMGHQ